MQVIYESVKGYFAHDEEAQLPLPAVPPRFGLKDASENRWEIFLDYIHKLNLESSSDTVYKFFLLSRHGQGYHNVAEEKYGTKAWDETWSKLNGDGQIIWGPDPQLTMLGSEQAHDIREKWIEEAEYGLPPPHRRYCSPLTRAFDTCDIISRDVYKQHPHRVLVVENCREVNGVHTCDKRQIRSHIEFVKPHFEIEDDLTELDELWSPTVRETKAEVALRARKVIDMVFEITSRDEIFISITSHSGFIDGFLTAIGRGYFPLPTGGVIPLVVKATRIRA